MAMTFMAAFAIMAACFGVAGVQYFALFYTNRAISVASPDECFADVEFTVPVI